MTDIYFKENIDDEGDVNLQCRVRGFYGGIYFSSNKEPSHSGWWIVTPDNTMQDSEEGIIPDEILIKIRDILNKRFPV